MLAILDALVDSSAAFRLSEPLANVQRFILSAPMAAPSSMQYDPVIAEIAAYACVRESAFSDEARANAITCLMDSLGCALRANSVPECRAVMEVWGTSSSEARGSRVPGLRARMHVGHAAAAITAAIRWLDFNDTWLAQEWGHPSDNLGAILAIADYMAADSDVGTRLTVSDILNWMIKAHEIQGVLALDNAFNRVGIDHVLLVKVASTAVAAAMLTDCDEDAVRSTVSHAWLDATLRTYRHWPNTGSRKSWAAADAVERAVKFAMLANAGEPGCQTALTAEGWGFQDIWFGGQSVTLQRQLGCYVMENILFKARYPAEFHGQTAIEAAVMQHPRVVGRADEILRVVIKTQEAGMRIINKTGPLRNEADRDHCIQYMTAVALLKGDVTSEDYEDEAASDPRIDELRSKMIVEEDPSYTRDYLDPELRSIGNSVEVLLLDGSSNTAVEVPLGHRLRRAESKPWLDRKFEANVRHSYPSGGYADRVLDAFSRPDEIQDMPISDFMAMLEPLEGEEVCRT